MSKLVITSEAEPTSCWLCGRAGVDDPLDTHHIFGGANRHKSDEYGLTVRLCHNRCHIFGNHSVHQDPAVMQELHEYGQRLAMERYGWSVEKFIGLFGKNYIDGGA